MLLSVASDYPYSVTEVGTLSAPSTDGVAAGIQSPLAANFLPTYSGDNVVIPRITSPLTTPQDSRQTSTVTGDTMEARTDTLHKIFNAVGSVLGAFGVEVTASGNGVSVYRAPSVGGTVYESKPGATPWQFSPALYLGAAALLAYVVLRKK